MHGRQALPVWGHAMIAVQHAVHAMAASYPSLVRGYLALRLLLPLRWSTSSPWAWSMSGMSGKPSAAGRACFPACGMQVHPGGDARALPRAVHHVRVHHARLQEAQQGRLEGEWPCRAVRWRGVAPTLVGLTWPP